MAKKKAAAITTECSVLLDVPYVDTNKYPRRNIFCVLDRHQAVALRCVQEGLEELNAKLNDGHVVKSAQDAMRWLLEEAERSASK